MISRMDLLCLGATALFLTFERKRKKEKSFKTDTKAKFVSSPFFVKYCVVATVVNDRARETIILAKYLFYIHVYVILFTINIIFVSFKWMFPWLRFIILFYRASYILYQLNLL